MDGPKPYAIHRRYLVKGEGWKHDKINIHMPFSEAGQFASATARDLDRVYGDGHFWTVELHDDPKAEYGAYFQLFHGRLS